jgi:acetyltransferase-like isoleucine patch superfamily enzyme
VPTEPRLCYKLVMLKRVLNRLAAAAPGGFSARPFLQRLRGAKVGRRVWLGQGVYFDELHPEAISIGENCTIGLRVSIFTHFYWGSRRGSEAAKPVVIEDDVFVGPHSVVLPGVTIGRGAVIQAGTVVARNVPPGVLWGYESAHPLAKVTVPLTQDTGFEQYVWGLRRLQEAKKPSRVG